MNIGIVGSGMIVNVILDVWAAFDDITATAIWCRPQDLAVAERIATERGIDRVYTDYDEFLADDSFDFAYIGLINSLHYEYSKKALLAGKSVVCEKPFTSTRVQAEELLAIARDQHVYAFESIITWNQDNYWALRDYLPQLGGIKLVQLSLSQYSRRYAAYLEGTILPVFNPQLDGGALYDMGVYSVHWVMGLFGKPASVTYLPNIGYNGIDTSGVLVMDYGDFKAVCITCKDSSSPSRMSIQGDAGYIVCDNDPSHNEDIRLVLNGREPVSIDVAKPGKSFSDIWKNILATTQDGAYEACYERLEDVIECMDVMEQARKGAGIVFSCD